ncbi:unnamed protein product, partial [Symbiodinium sp. KB8]
NFFWRKFKIKRRERVNYIGNIKPFLWLFPSRRGGFHSMKRTSRGQWVGVLRNYQLHELRRAETVPEEAEFGHIEALPSPWVDAVRNSAARWPNRPRTSQNRTRWYAWCQKDPTWQDSHVTSECAGTGPIGQIGASLHRERRPSGQSFVDVNVQFDISR